MVTGNHFRMVPSLTTYNLPFPKIEVPNTPQYQLHDACCHLANIIEDTQEISCAYDNLIVRAVSPFAKLLYPLSVIMDHAHCTGQLHGAGLVGYPASINAGSTPQEADNQPQEDCVRVSDGRAIRSISVKTSDVTRSKTRRCNSTRFGTVSVYQ